MFSHVLFFSTPRLLSAFLKKTVYIYQYIIIINWGITDKHKKQTSLHFSGPAAVDETVYSEVKKGTGLGNNATYVHIGIIIHTNDFFCFEMCYTLE